MEINGAIEKRKGIIVVGMISSGKSTFLNSLLGISYLEANDNITTKMVVIIRYNEKLDKPKFYHLKVIEDKDIEGGYLFEKDGDESIGEIEIIKRISEINKQEAKFSENGEPKYDNLFYMIETNIKSIENKEFLKTHDFYDIPGLNEFMRTKNNENESNTENNNENNEEEEEEYMSENEENEDTSNQNNNNNNNNTINNNNNNNNNERNNYVSSTNENMRYIKGIFKYLKKIIEREIIVLSSETYYKPQNLQIIKEIKKYLNVPLTDNLIILNKIDISNDRNRTIADCKQFYVNNIDSTIFNINYNKFAPLNSMQFKNELLMRTDYKYYYLYYFNKYKEQYVNITDEKSKLIKKITFIEFLVDQMTEGIKNEEKMSYLEGLANEFEDDKFELIKGIYEEIKNKSNLIVEYGIDFDDEYDDSMLYMKAFYQNFAKKLKFPEMSEDIKAILEYFNNFKDKSEDLETAPLVIQNTDEGPETKAIKILKDIFKKLQKYVNKNDKDHIINELASNLDIMEKFILNNRKIYIPFIGVSSAGKTTTINGLVGFKLFPEALNECTTRGIIIEYSDATELYEMQIDSNNNYYVFNEKNRVAEGYKEVREYLESLNFRYGRNESKFFYKVKTPIKIFDDLEFENELKNRILLIDLPGPDTKNNKFNCLYKNKRTPYEKLLCISSSFIYVNKGRAIKSTENQKILNKLYNNIQDSSSLSGIDYLKACFFVINAFTSLNDNEINLEEINEDIASILFSNTDPMYEICKKEIKSSLFNAKNFYDYLKESTLLKDNESLIEIFSKDYLKRDENSIVFKKDSFPKFCLQKLKSKVKDLGFNDINSKQKCPEDFLNKINNIFSYNMEILKMQIKGMDNKIINEIANILYYFEDENYIKQNMIAYKNSFSEEFLDNLKNQIIYSKNYKDEDYLKKLKDILKYFDTFFESNIKKPSSTTAEEFKKKKKELDDGLNKILREFDVDAYFKETKKSIKDEMKKQKLLIKFYLDQKKEADEILNIIKEEIKKHFNTLQDKINNGINIFNKDIENFTSKIKEITMNFSQRDDLKNNEKYNNYLNELLLSNEKIVFDHSQESNSFIGKIMVFFYNIKNFFQKKNETKEIIEKINLLQDQLLKDLKMKNRAFNLKIIDQGIKIKDNFKSILSLSFSDLSNIEEKEWKECISSYYDARKLLLSIENREEIEKQIEKEKKEESESLIEKAKIEEKKEENETKTEEDKKEETKEENEIKKEEEKDGEKKE